MEMLSLLSHLAMIRTVNAVVTRFLVGLFGCLMQVYGFGMVGKTAGKRWLSGGFCVERVRIFLKRLILMKPFKHRQ